MQVGLNKEDRTPSVGVCGHQACPSLMRQSRGTVPMLLVLSHGKHGIHTVHLKSFACAAQFASADDAEITPAAASKQKSASTLPQWLLRSMACLILSGQVLVRILKGKVHVKNTLDQLKLVGPRSLGVALLHCRLRGNGFHDSGASVINLQACAFVSIRTCVEHRCTNLRALTQHVCTYAVQCVRMPTVRCDLRSSMVSGLVLALTAALAFQLAA